MGHIYLVIGCLLLVDDLCYQRQTQSYMDDSLINGTMVSVHMERLVGGGIVALVVPREVR